MVEKFTQAQTRTVVYKKNFIIKEDAGWIAFPIFYTSCVIQCGGQTETDGVEPGLVLVFHFSPILFFSTYEQSSCQRALHRSSFHTKQKK